MMRPVVKAPSISNLFGRRRRRREIEFDDDLFENEFEDEEKVAVITDPMELATQFR